MWPEDGGRAAATKIGLAVNLDTLERRLLDRVFAPELMRPQLSILNEHPDAAVADAEAVGRLLGSKQSHATAYTLEIMFRQWNFLLTGW